MVGNTTTVSTGTLQLKPGKPTKVHLTGWKNILTGLVAGVPYYLTATLIDATGNTATAVSATSFTI